MRGTEFYIELASSTRTTMIMELDDHNKSTHEYFAVVDEKKSQRLLSEEEKKALPGIMANNDLSESGFLAMTQVLSDFGYIDLLSASGIGQTRFNGDIQQDLTTLITDRKSKIEDTNT